MENETVFSKALRGIVFDSILPIACAWLLGYAFFREHIFYRQYPTFQFVWHSVVAVLFFNMLKLDRRGALALLLVLFFVGTGFVSEAAATHMMRRDIIVFLSLAIPVFLFHRFFYPLKLWRGMGQPFILSAMLGVAFLLDAVGFNFAYGISSRYSVGLFIRTAFYPLVVYNFMIGFAIGLGIFLNDLNALPRLGKQLASFLNFKSTND